MAQYRVLIKPSAVKEIEGIPFKKDRRRILKRVGKLREEPRPPGCEKLSGRARYRLRQGPYRIIYSVDDKIFLVCVVKVGHRKDVYRG